MDEHVLGLRGGGLLVGHKGGRDGDLEPAHVSGIPSVLQAILVAFQEKLELVPASVRIKQVFNK